MEQLTRALTRQQARRAAVHYQGFDAARKRAIDGGGRRGRLEVLAFRPRPV